VSLCQFKDNKVLLVVVITEMDALESEDWKVLRKENLSLQQAK